MAASATELAWAAGFFDGEGTAGAAKTKSRPQLRLRLSQVDREPLDRFQSAVGLGRVNGPYEKRSPLTGELVRPQYRYQVVANQAKTVIELLWPYLSGPKREQIARALEES